MHVFLKEISLYSRQDFLKIQYLLCFLRYKTELKEVRLQNSPFLRQKFEKRGFWASFDARSWTGRTGEEGVTRPGEKGNGERGCTEATVPSFRLSPHFLFPLTARLLPRFVLAFYDRASKLAQKPRFLDFWRRKGLFCSLQRSKMYNLFIICKTTMRKELMRPGARAWWMGARGKI